MSAWNRGAAIVLALGALGAGVLLSSAPALAGGGYGLSGKFASAGSGSVRFAGLGATPPAPKTDAPSEVRASHATLNGELNPEGVAGGLGFYFSYAAGASCTGPGSATTPLDNGGSNATGSSEVSESATVTGLQPSTEYAFCFVAENANGPTDGPTVTFTTASALQAFAPTVDGESVSGVTPFDARLEASLSTENEATDDYFEYATNAALTGATTIGQGTLPGSLTPQPAPPYAEREVECPPGTPGPCTRRESAPVDLGGGLTPASTYYYRVIATNASGTSEGPVQSFQTLAAQKPAIEAESASELTQTGAHLYATVNPEYEATKVQFKLGTDTSYSLGGALETERELGASFGGREVSVDLASEGVAAVSKLQPNTDYHYEAVATNATGTTEGLSAVGDGTFLTSPNPPTVKTGGASNVQAYSATIAGEVNPGASGYPNQDNTTYWFQYSANGSSYNYGVPLTPARTPIYANAGEGTSPVAESAQLSALAPGTTYHYRIVAFNVRPEPEKKTAVLQFSYGEDREFTTPSTPPILGETSVSGITTSGASFGATLDAEGLSTLYALRLGTEQGVLQAAGSGRTSANGAQPLTFTVSSLLPGTTYYYEVVAESPDGTVQSPEGSFTTTPSPTAVVPIQPVRSFPQVPLLGFSASAFPPEEASVVTKTTQAGKCSKGKERSRGRCVKAKRKRNAKRGKGKR
jgi:hypothetical protein